MGEVKFDMQKARKYADMGDLMKTTKWLYAALNEIDRLQKDNESLMDALLGGGAKIVINSSEQSKRVTELEGYLCESTAISLYNFQRYEAAIGERHMVTDPARSWDDLGEDERELRTEIAKKMLHCDGKL